MNAVGQAGRQAIDLQVGALYTVPAKAADVRRQIEATGAGPEPWVINAERQRARYEAYRDQLEIAKDSNLELLERLQEDQDNKRQFCPGR